MISAALLLLKFLKKSADSLPIEHFYTELMLLEPMAQLGYYVTLVLDGPRRIPLFAQLFGKSIGVGDQWPL